MLQPKAEALPYRGADNADDNICGREATTTTTTSIPFVSAIILDESSLDMVDGSPAADEERPDEKPQLPLDLPSQLSYKDQGRDLSSLVMQHQQQILPRQEQYEPSAEREDRPSTIADTGVLTMRDTGVPLATSPQQEPHDSAQATQRRARVLLTAVLIVAAAVVVAVVVTRTNRTECGSKSKTRPRQFLVASHCSNRMICSLLLDVECL